MVELNLLPPEYRYLRRRTLFRHSRLLLIPVVVVGVLLVALWLGLTLWLWQARLNTWRDQARILAPAERQELSMQSEILNWKQQIPPATPPWDLVVGATWAARPAGVLLQGFNQAGTEWTIEGQAPDLASVGAYVTNLGSTSYWRDLRLVDVQGQGSGYHFTLQGRLLGVAG